MGKKIRAIFRATIWGSVGVDPYTGDEIKREMAKFDSEDEAEDAIEDEKDVGDDDGDVDGDGDGDEHENEQLTDVLEFYSCDHLLPYAQYILWLSNVKEALGHIPQDFDLDHDAIVALVILLDETNKKSQYDMNESKEKQRTQSQNLPQPTSASASTSASSKLPSPSIQHQRRRH